MCRAFISCPCPPLSQLSKEAVRYDNIVNPVTHNVVPTDLEFTDELNPMCSEQMQCLEKELSYSPRRSRTTQVHFSQLYLFDFDLPYDKVYSIIGGTATSTFSSHILDLAPVIESGAWGINPTRGPRWSLFRPMIRRIRTAYLLQYLLQLTFDRSAQLPGMRRTPAH